MLDLEGKSVMMSEGNRYNSSLTTLLDYFNLNNEKVNFLKPSFDIKDFIDKKVDAITGFRSNELYELDKKNIPYNLIDPVSYGFTTNAINLFSSSKKVQENPKQIKNFLMASKKGWEYALSHIEEVAELIHKKYQPNKSVEHLIYEGKRTVELMLVDMYDIGEINEEFVLKTLKHLIYQKKVDQNQSIENLFIKKDSNVLAATLLTFTEEEKKWIEKHPIVSFTGDPNWLPYESFEADGSYIGIVAEYLKLITKLSGLRFEPQPVRSWTEAVEMAMNSRVKVISGDSADKKLNQKFHPVRSYSQNPIVIIMDTKHDYVEDLNLIADKKIAIIKDYGYTADIFKIYPNIKFIEVENIQEGLEGVVKGDFDVMLATMALASYTIQEMQLHTLKIVGKTPIVMNLTLFVSKDEPLLHSIINKILRVITKEQKHQIMHKWTENKYIEKVDYRLLWQVSGVLTVLFLLLLAWSYRMRIEIKKREILELKNREIQERLSFALQGSNDGLWDWNFITNDVYFSPRWKEILGYKESEIVNKFESWESLLHPDDIKSSWDELNRYLGSQDKSDRFTIKFRMKHKDGHFVPILSRANKVYNNHAEVVRMVGTHVDLTELIKVQEAYKRER
jgi:PAS domain S-box-containing protein